MAGQEKIDAVLHQILGDEILDWEREELSRKIAAAAPRVQGEIMRHLPVIWPVSYVLFDAFVDQAARAAGCLDPKQFHDWVKAVLDVYEADGLRAAQLFMEEVEDHYLCELRGEAGAVLDEARPVLKGLARVLTGRDITITAAPVPSYDTETLFLPATIHLCPGRRQNFLFYKLTVIFMTTLEAQGIFVRETDRGGVDIEEAMAAFAEQQIARDLFFLLEAGRALATIRRRYDGLVRDCGPVFAALAAGIPTKAATPRVAWITELQRLVLGQGSGERPARNHLPAALMAALDRHFHAGCPAGAVEICGSLFARLSSLPGPWPTDLTLPFMGRLDAAGAYARITARRERLRNEFLSALGAALPRLTPYAAADPANPAAGTGQPDVDRVGVLLAMAAGAGDHEADKSGAAAEFLTLGLEELPPELVRLAQSAHREFGEIPRQWISSAVGRPGGGHPPRGIPESEDPPAPAPAPGALTYDEWDYRRRGFRKNWCTVICKEVEPTGGTFVAHTLEKYRGQLVTLRRQFEMMSLQERVMRRRREGDEIDLDAVVESVMDIRAGLPPSERLYCRHQRNDRDIATLFLVDMSSSTEGWINTALKEALILMSEGLAALGDRYAIYGFSGMRRLRNEFFRVKDFSTPYNDETKARIAGISPREYTRMGPAIRHALTLLSEVEAKVRLLVTLSDGKPEDYDHYKGDYAIEDTRHALIEAKAAGVHPFCITVDRQAHEYISHMYGEVNYIFIDEVAKLPLRIPEIYRMLTT